MREFHLRCVRSAAIIVGVALSLAGLSACGTVESLRGPAEGASTEKEARNIAPNDPLARPVQVAWTSARASYCGFIFNADQLRASYLAAEQMAGNTPEQMKKIAHAYDYTRDSTYKTIKDDLAYCNKERTDAIRKDLHRYLAGDYTPSSRMAQ
jgi:hypothetical protein